MTLNASILTRQQADDHSRRFDLLWARESVGLTQAQAAEKMGVHRDTFSRWETGTSVIPARKLQVFLHLINVNPHDIPKRAAPRQYDAEGYPVGFDRTPFDGEHSRTGDWDCDGEEEALEKIECDEFPARARERYRLLMTAHMHEETATRHMAEYDEETRRIAAGMPHRLDEEVHPRLPDERMRDRVPALVCDWLRDPEGMAARIRTDAEKRIHDLQALASRWASLAPKANAINDLV